MPVEAESLPIPKKGAARALGDQEQPAPEEVAFNGYSFKVAAMTAEERAILTSALTGLAS